MVVQVSLLYPGFCGGTSCLLYPGFCGGASYSVISRVLWWCKLACYIQGSVVVQVSLLYPGFCGGTS